MIAISPIATISRMRTSRSSSRCNGERRRPACQPPGDAPDLGGRPDRGDDALAATTDDTGSRIGHDRRSATTIPGGSGSTAADSGTDSPVRMLRSATNRSTRRSRSRPGRYHRSAAGRCHRERARMQRRRRPARLAEHGRVALTPPSALRVLVAAVFGHDVGADDRDEPAEDQQTVADLASRMALTPAASSSRTNGWVADCGPSARCAVGVPPRAHSVPPWHHVGGPPHLASPLPDPRRAMPRPRRP